MEFKFNNPFKGNENDEELKNSNKTPGVAAAALVAALSLGAAEGSQGYSQDTQRDIIPDSVAIKDVSAYSPTYERFHSMIESGKYELKEAAEALARLIVNPVDIGGTLRIEHNPELNFDVPYEYARLFNTGKMKDPKDVRKIQEYVASQIKELLNPAIADLAFSVEEYKKEFPEGFSMSALDVKSLSVTGSASPEGRAIEGLSVNETDEENTSLARLRAMDAEKSVVAAMKELGFNDDFAKNIKWGEQQLSPDEVVTLERVAERAEMTPIELIKAYNRHEISDKVSIALLNQILDKKRNATVAIQRSEGKNYIATLPLSPLFLLPFVWRRRRSEVGKRAGEGIGRGAEALRKMGKKVFAFELSKSSPELKNEEILSQPVEVLSRRVIADIEVDISLYETIVRELYKEEGGEAEGEPISLEVVASRVLKSWQDHDNETRGRIGLPSIPFDSYAENAEATVYAYLHAAALRRMASEITRGSTDIEETWNSWFKNKDGVRYAAQIDVEMLAEDARKLYMETQKKSASVE